MARLSCLIVKIESKIIKCTSMNFLIAKNCYFFFYHKEVLESQQRLVKPVVNQFKSYCYYFTKT